MKAIVLIASLLAAFTASASDKLELSIRMYLNNELIKSELVESQSGRQHVLTADKLLKFDVTPLASESTVKLSSVMYTFNEGAFQQLEEPELEVAFNKPAVIEVGTEGGEIFKIEVVAKKI